MNALSGFSPIARGVIVAAAIALLIALIQAASPILGPILLAVFIAVVVTPALRWMRRHKVPKWIALGVIVFVLLDVGSIFLLLATGALEGFRDSLPGYQERFRLLSEQLGFWLEGVGMAGSNEAMEEMFDPAEVTALVRVILSSVGNMVGSGFLILLAVVFMLIEAPNLPAKLKEGFGFTEESQERLRRMLNAINRYMVIKSMTSLGTALCVLFWLWLLGIDFAVLWAILAFLLNFIPYVGAVLMAIPAVLLALVQTDPRTTLLVILGYLTINAAIGNILEPRMMGRGLGISMLAVFLSLLFWGWVLGTVGAFLSVPLTMALMIAFDGSSQTRPIAILLGPKIEEKLESKKE